MIARRWLVALSLSLLAACGGGGSSTDGAMNVDMVGSPLDLAGVDLSGGACAIPKLGHYGLVTLAGTTATSTIYSLGADNGDFDGELGLVTDSTGKAQPMIAIAKNGAGLYGYDGTGFYAIVTVPDTQQHLVAAPITGSPFPNDGAHAYAAFSFVNSSTMVAIADQTVYCVGGGQTFGNGTVQQGGGLTQAAGINGTCSLVANGAAQVTALMSNGTSTAAVTTTHADQAPTSTTNALGAPIAEVIYGGSGGHAISAAGTLYSVGAGGFTKLRDTKLCTTSGSSELGKPIGGFTDLAY